MGIVLFAGTVRDPRSGVEVDQAPTNAARLFENQDPAHVKTSATPMKAVAGGDLGTSVETWDEYETPFDYTTALPQHPAVRSPSPSPETDPPDTTTERIATGKLASLLVTVRRDLAKLPSI